MLLTQVRLRKLLYYNPCTGVFNWRVARQGAKADYPAGCIDRYNGYRRITVDSVPYQASRLAWLYIYGEWPAVIDHVNRRRADDSIWNLANGTAADNARNSANYIDGRASGRKRRSQKRYKHHYHYIPNQPR